jgi:TRAP-type C4-dicarboxylate transport system substrate-binding protein
MWEVAPYLATVPVRSVEEERQEARGTEGPDMRGMRTYVGVLALAALVLGGCASELSAAPRSGDKAGGEAAPVMLRLGTPDAAGRRGADQVEEFARQVEERTGGSLRIEPVLQAAGHESAYEGEPDDYPGWDQLVARQVMAGDLDLALVPARAWDTEGVDSMRALHAPFLVTSRELLDEIVTSELAEELLSGLEAVGVTGLALVPEELRRLLFFGDPPAGPYDLSGRAVRAPRSATTYAVLESFGAAPDDFPGPGDPFLRGVESGEIVAAEAALALAGTLPSTTTAHADVVLFPKVNALVVNSDTLAGLSSEHQAALRAAAEATVVWAVENGSTEVQDAEVFCTNGGRILPAVGTGPLEAAVRPVLEQLEGDPTTRALMTGIRALADDLGTTTDVVPPCGEQVLSEGDDAPGVGEDEFPGGIYRAEVTAESLVEAGVDRPSAHEHEGMWTVTIQDGRVQESTCQGTYEVVDGRIVITLGDDTMCGSASNKVLFSAGWTFDDGELWFTDVRSGHGSDVLVEALFGGRAWTRIG